MTANTNNIFGSALKSVQFCLGRTTACILQLFRIEFLPSAFTTEQEQSLDGEGERKREQGRGEERAGKGRRGSREGEKREQWEDILYSLKGKGDEAEELEWEKWVEKTKELEEEWVEKTKELEEESVEKTKELEEGFEREVVVEAEAR